MEYYSVIKKENIFDNMNELWGHHSKWNKLDREDKYCVISHTEYKCQSHKNKESAGDCWGLGVWEKWADGQRLLTSIYKF